MSHPSESHLPVRHYLPPLQSSSYRYAIPPAGPYYGLHWNYPSSRFHSGEPSSSSFYDEHGRSTSESLVRLPTACAPPDHSNFRQVSPWIPCVPRPPSLTYVCRDSHAQLAQGNESQLAHAPSPGATVPDLSSLLASSNTMQAHMSGVQTDVRNVLKELRTLKNTQKNLVERVDSLDEALGVSHNKTGQKHAKGSKGKAKDKTSGQVFEEGNSTSQPPVANLLDRLGAIEVAVQKLLDHTESRSCERSIYCHAATSPPLASFPLDTSVAEVAQLNPAQVIPIQMTSASETLSCRSIPAYTSATASQSSVKHVSVQACDSSSAHPALSHVSSVQGSEYSVDPVGPQSLARDPVCASDRLHPAAEAATASPVLPLLSLQQPPPFAPIPGVAKSTLPAAPSSLPAGSDDLSPLDSRTRSTPVDAAPAINIPVSVGSCIAPSALGGGALAGASSTARVTAPDLPSVRHRSFMDHSPNDVIDNGVINDTSVQSSECSNRLQPQATLPSNPSVSSDPLSIALRQIASSVSASPLAGLLLDTRAGSMQESINTTSPSVHPVDSRTGGEDEDIVCPGLNLTSLVPSLPTETTLAASTQTTTEAGSCAVNRNSNVCMEEEGFTSASQDDGDPRKAQCNHGAGAGTSEAVVVSEPPHNGQSERTVETVSAHQLLLSSSDGGRESTLTDNQHMQEEQDVLRALVPTTPLTGTTSPVSVPSLILPSMTGSRCSSVVPRGGTVLSNNPALDAVVFLDPHSVFHSAPANEKLSSSTLLSSISSLHARLSTPPSPLTSIRSSVEPLDPENLQDDAPFATYIVKQSRGLIKGSGGKHGGPSASLPELMKLARRESQSLPAKGMKVSKTRKRKRGDPEDIKEAYVTDTSHLSSYEPGVSPRMEAGVTNTTDRGGASSGPGENAISLTKHDKELISKGANSLKIVIPAKKRFRTGELPVTELEASQTPVEDLYQKTSPDGDCNRGVRQRHVVLSGKVVKMDADLSWDGGDFDLQPTFKVKSHPAGERGRPRGKRKSTNRTKEGPSRVRRRQSDMMAAVALPDTFSHQRTVILQSWPDLKAFSSSWERQLIQCDNCDMWYHYGCVGVGKHDPRLDSEAAFICPLCFVQIARRQTLRHRAGTCARPDCPHAADAPDDLYFVERLVGREAVGQVGYRWLAKWDGYPMSEASWIPQGNLTGEADKLLKQFELDAVCEGMDLSEKVVILSEATAAGWTC